jgi:hypothetical protein
MTEQADSRRLERRAKALMIDREIPQSKMDAVRSLMSNRTLDSDERNRAIIELIQNCPEKKSSLRLKNIEAPPRNKRAAAGGDRDNKNRETSGEIQTVSPFAPTETSYYIDDLIIKYRPLRLFKKRYLAKRDNRLGIGFRKRLIPNKSALDILKEIKKIQTSLLPLISRAMLELLNDPENPDPLSYNLLKQVRRWLNDTPLANINFNRAKWMERIHFEREFRDYIISFFSFLKLPSDLKEGLYAVFEGRIRSFALLDSGRAELTINEQRAVHEAAALFRSFIPAGFNEDTMVASRVRSLCGISYSELLLVMTEVLCFQRPLNREELVPHYGITHPPLNRETWDCSSEMLERAGKDSLSLKRKELKELEERSVEFEPVTAALKITLQGRNLLLACVEDEWRYIERKHYDSAVVYEENFLSFIESLISYFNLTYAGILRGEPLRLKNSDGLLFTTRLFDTAWFRGFEAELNPVLDEIHFFKTKNPSLALSKIEIRKIVSGQIGSMPHISSFIRRISEFFFTLGMDLMYLHDAHKQSADTIIVQENVPVPIKIHGEPMTAADAGYKKFIIPNHQSSIDEFEVNTVLNRRFNGKNLTGDGASLFNELSAFCLQFSKECFNEKISAIESRAGSITLRIDELKKEIEADIKKSISGL